MKGRFYFATGRSSVKGQNLLGNGHAALHLDDSSDVLTVEGLATVVDSDQTQQVVDEELSRKYVTIRSGSPYTLAMNPDAQLWMFTPTHAVAWWEMAMAATSRRWSWRGGPEPDLTLDWRPFGRQLCRTSHSGPLRGSQASPRFSSR